MMYRRRLVRFVVLCGLLLLTVVGANLACANSPEAQVIDTEAASSTVTPYSTNAPLVYGKPSDIVWEALASINRDRALTDLRRVTGGEPICGSSDCYTVTNRPTGSEGLGRVKAYVETQLADLGYSVVRNNWSAEGYSDQNVIATKLGSVLPDEQIYLVAHLDGAGNTGGIYPAADDDASGAVDLIETARILSGYTFSRTLVLFFSTGEEQGSLGVNSYLSKLSAAEISKIKYVVDLDMIGYDANADGVMQLFHGDHAPSKALATSFKDIILHYGVNLVPDVTVGCA
ncbi:MAG: M28 family peptidase [Chloroflexi bacterium]|nr:M28 family peptidase [Chloroflexota bacterium]